MPTKIIAAVLVVLLLGIAPASAQAGVLSDEQLGNIRQVCREAQGTLRTLQKRDTVLRINRGRLYDLTLRQTGAFVSRLDVNKIDAPDVKAADTAIRAKFLQFKEDYDRYAGSLEQAITADCSQKPQEFYSSLAAANGQRKAVADDVASIKEQMSKYVNSLQQLNDRQFPVTGGSQ